jgi:hypothetical protein
MQQGAGQTFSVSSRVDTMKIHKQLKSYHKKRSVQNNSLVATKQPARAKREREREAFWSLGTATPNYLSSKLTEIGKDERNNSFSKSQPPGF